MLRAVRLPKSPKIRSQDLVLDADAVCVLSVQVSGKLTFEMTHSVLEEYIWWSFSLTPNSTAQPERVKPDPPGFLFFFYYFDMALVILPACNPVSTRYVPLSPRGNLQGRFRYSGLG